MLFRPLVGYLYQYRSRYARSNWAFFFAFHRRIQYVYRSTYADHIPSLALLAIKLHPYFSGGGGMYAYRVTR